ncbi:MAG: Nudix family hydrolase [Cellvibrio sp.]
MSRIVHVAVGVVVDDLGNILIAKRPDGVHQGGLWEFPGGKVEANETLFDALKRELHEELAIEVQKTEPLIKIRHDYGDKIVLLDVHKVIRFIGVPHGNEGQPVKWVAPAHLNNYNFPAANRPIITAIQLPRHLLITGEYENREDFISRIERALENGIRIIQLRVKDPEVIQNFIGVTVELCNKFSAKLSVNTPSKDFHQISVQNVGLHLNSKNLLACDIRPVAKNVLLSASCHNQTEIAHAQKIGVDFICVSPVLATKSHPEQQGIGWVGLGQLLESLAIPAYALGGMKEEHLPLALAHGAQGIAAISEWW